MEYELGEHLVSGRFGYTHHGIYIGNSEVIHYSGLADGLSAGPVAITTLAEFSAGKALRVRRYAVSPYSGEAAVGRAMTRIGEDKYDLQANNCEHFCSWVRTGKHVSEQVQFVETMAGAIGAGLSEYRKQRYHDATLSEAAWETGKAAGMATVKVFAATANAAPVFRVLRRLVK